MLRISSHAGISCRNAALPDRDFARSASFIFRPRIVYSNCSGRILSLRSGTGANHESHRVSRRRAPLAARRSSSQSHHARARRNEAPGKPISALTAYDYPTARLVDEAGIDLILVGDSLAMVVLGHENTLAVTVDEMLHHTRAVRRAVRRALVVADMPFGSYHGAVAEAVANAVRFVKEAGAEAVKIEGPRVELVRALVEAEIPVIGHLGLTPQSVHRMGGYRVQARTADAVLQLQADAFALAACRRRRHRSRRRSPRGRGGKSPPRCPFPRSASAPVPTATARSSSSTTSSNLTFAPAAKFVRRYADASALFRSAIEHYREDVEHRAFPSDAESYHLPETALSSDAHRTASGGDAARIEARTKR